VHASGALTELQQHDSLLVMPSCTWRIAEVQLGHAEVELNVGEMLIIDRQQARLLKLKEELLGCSVLLERPLRLAVLQCRVSEPLMRFGQLQLQPMARQDGNECKSRGRENDGVASEGQGKGEGNTVRAHARAKLEMWV